ncbi:MAG: MaoC family dehydratase [Alphaproteobacteria bacterium]|nr:MaoC family dehydratase [Alphaproteobacteria bacterium]
MTATQGYFIEDMTVGLAASFTKTVSEKDIAMYADVSGDTNPVHLNEAFAAQTPFKTRIAHGMLSAGFISAVLGTKLPGPGAIYMSQTLRFKAPVKIGDTVTATCTVTEVVPEKRRAMLSTVCKIGDTVVIEGEAMVMVPSRPK